MLRRLVNSASRWLFGFAYPSVSQRAYIFRKKITKGYFALNGLDRKLEKYVNFDNGFFVELGANDGVSQSNSLYFEIHRNWHGVLVEPSPHNFLRCRETRSNKNSIFCNACVGFQYKEKYVDIEYANLMSISKNLDLDLSEAEKDEHIRKARSFLSDSDIVFNFGAIARPLNDILLECEAPKGIDFLSLDVEGAELEVLMGIDFSYFKFSFMLIEIRDFPRMETFLNKNGYVFVERFSHHDYLFKNRDT